MSTIITISSTITVLVSHIVTVFGLDILCLWAMLSIRRLLQMSPLPLPLTRFSRGVFVALQQLLYQVFFALITLLQNIIHFQSKINFFFQLIAGRFWFCCFVYMYFFGFDSWGAFSQFFHHETTSSCILSYLHSFLFGLSSNHVAKQKNSW